MGLSIFEKAAIVLVLLLVGFFLFFKGDGGSSISGQVVSPLVEGSKTHYIEVYSNKFEPEFLEVKKGDIVVWRNVDLVKHNIYFEGLDVNLGDIEPGNYVDFTFSESKDYVYGSKFNSKIKGKLRVLDK